MLCLLGPITRSISTVLKLFNACCVPLLDLKLEEQSRTPRVLAIQSCNLIFFVRASILLAASHCTIKCTPGLIATPMEERTFGDPLPQQHWQHFPQLRKTRHADKDITKTSRSPSFYFFRVYFQGVCVCRSSINVKSSTCRNWTHAERSDWLNS